MKPTPNKPGTRYAIRLENNQGSAAYLEANGNTSWCKRVALKHLRDIASKEWIKHYPIVILEETT